MCVGLCTVHTYGCAREHVCINASAPDIILHQVFLTISYHSSLAEVMPGCSTSMQKLLHQTWTKWLIITDCPNSSLWHGATESRTQGYESTAASIGKKREMRTIFIIYSLAWGAVAQGVRFTIIFYLLFIYCMLEHSNPLFLCVCRSLSDNMCGKVLAQTSLKA